MPRYREPQLPETGQLLGRSLLGVYLDNDRYFHGLGDRQRSIPRACYEGGLSSGQSEGNIWSGYHFFRSDAGGLASNAVLPYPLPASRDGLSAL